MSEHRGVASRRAARAGRTAVIASAAALALLACARPEDGGSAGDTATAAASPPPQCPGDNGGLTLAAGFCATVFADSLGHARHLTVTADGDVYVNTWSGKYYTTPAPAGGFLVALRDTTGDGVADVKSRFGRTKAAGGTGGTGIALYDGALYAEADDRIVRYALTPGTLAPAGQPETIISGLPLGGDHFAHPFAIDTGGALFVNSGSPSNSCQVKNRTNESPGQQPCAELRLHAGIWRYHAKRRGQRFSAAERYATGIRNAIGITVGPDGRLYATQHGRDQLAENWPKLFTPEQGQNLPAELLLQVEEGDDYGWPYCYYDAPKGQHILAPEYGGDGTKVEQCEGKKRPFGTFRAHWAPNGLAFYTGTQFPAPYHGGMFVAFHGSWNRAPGAQEGYNVMFVPVSGGKTGNYSVFADGFAGEMKQPDRAKHRPVGVAVGPKGELYISEDVSGRVWRVTYGGGR